MIEMQLVLDRDRAREIIGEDDEEYRVVNKEHLGNSRWSIHESVVFTNNQQDFWRMSYSYGATESQDERPFEYDEQVTAVRVVPVTKTIIEYELAKLSIDLEATQWSTPQQTPNSNTPSQPLSQDITQAAM